MAWTAPRTWTTGEVVTASIMNTHVRDNQLAIKSWIDTITFNDVTGSRAIDGTVYQNTSGKIKLVAINIRVPTGSIAGIELFTDSGASPSTKICEVGSYNTSSGILSFQACMLVQKNHYYKADDGATSPTLYDWMEWDFVGSG